MLITRKARLHDATRTQIFIFWDSKTRITVPRTSLDLLLFPWTTLDSVGNQKMAVGRRVFIQGLNQKIVIQKSLFSGGKKWHLNKKLPKKDVEDPNYRTQNEFGFAIVSVDEPGLEENSKNAVGS